MATKTWYINPADRTKVVLAAGAAATDIHKVTQEDGGTPRAVSFKAVGQAISAAEATAANAEQDAGAVPAVDGPETPGGQGAAIAAPAGGATVDAEARTAINAILTHLRSTGQIAP